MADVACAQRLLGWLLDVILPTFDEAVRRLPAEHLDFRPIHHARSAKGLVHHVYQTLVLLLRGVDQGRLEREDAAFLFFDVGQVRHPDQLLAFADQARAYAREVIARLTTEKLTRSMATFFAPSMTGEEAVRKIVEEVLHHRGQLFLYLELLGAGDVPYREAL
jgi:uncharacterized damage-inducible protein DinB